MPAAPARAARLARDLAAVPARALDRAALDRAALDRAALDRATADLDPPLAAVDLAAFDHNAGNLVRRAGGRPIRMASKSVRCRFLLDRVLSRPGFTGLLCYSLREALWLCATGTCRDLVVGYPSVDRRALAALAADPVARGAITVMADCAGHLDLIDEVAGPGHAAVPHLPPWFRSVNH